MGDNVEINVLLWLLLLKCVAAQRRIVGGEDAEDGEFPYLVYVSSAAGKCTGSVVGTTWVLTAAHCFISASMSVEITAGVVDITKRSEAQIRQSKRIVIHPMYWTGRTGKFDFALVEVSKEFDLNSKVGILELYGGSWPLKNQNNVKCMAAGWGVTATGNNQGSKVLKKLNVTARHGLKTCPCLPYFLEKRVVCLERMRNKGICFGDSGGPLVCMGMGVGVAHVAYNRRTCDFTFSGIPRVLCGIDDTINVYMYICPELDWIRKYVSDVPPTPASCRAVPTFVRPTKLLYILLTVCYLFDRIKIIMWKL